MQIYIKDIEVIFRRFLEKLQFEVGPSINVESDFYLNIPTAEWDKYTFQAREESLYDDVENLKKLATDANRPCTFVDFDRLASLLRYISESYNPSTGAKASNNT